MNLFTMIHVVMHIQTNSWRLCRFGWLLFLPLDQPSPTVRLIIFSSRVLKKSLCEVSVVVSLGSSLMWRQLDSLRVVLKSSPQHCNGEVCIFLADAHRGLQADHLPNTNNATLSNHKSCCFPTIFFFQQILNCCQYIMLGSEWCKKNLNVKFMEIR